MARLSVHGSEVLRVEREVSNPRGDLTTWERTQRAFCRRNGTIRRLDKLTVMFRPGPYDPPEGRRHCYGWKLAGKVKTGLTVAELAERYSAAGWTVVKGGAA